MENQELKLLNTLINQAYECASFTDFLKLAILDLHKLVAYDSGVFFCAISQDSSFFKPYVGGPVESHYQKKPFDGREALLKESEENGAGVLPVVYTARDFFEGRVRVGDEPRSLFLTENRDFHTACLRIVYKEKFLGEIYLHRSCGGPPFSEEDVFCLKLLQPHISTVISNIHALLALRQTESAGRSKCGLCLLDEHLSVTGTNACGLDMLKITTVFGSSLLYHVKEMCAELTREGTDGKSSVFKTLQGDIKAEVSRAGSQSKFVVEMESLSKDPLASDYKYKFSKREAEIIDALIQGKNNRQIAQSIRLSPNTIKTHVKNIFKKAGVGNRTELAFLLMGGVSGSME
jgi:DNA-binding CsgD family transcriptional regulator